MLAAVALVSSPPILVPELAGSAVDETTDLRAATLAVGDALGRHASAWIAIGAGETRETVSASSVGTYAGFGAEVIVALAPGAAGAADRRMPLTALTAAWIRTGAAPDARVEVRTFPSDAGVDDCRRYGLALRAELDGSAEPVGLLVVADGATTLTAKAPGSFHEGAPQIQDHVNRALAGGDIESIEGLDADVCREIGMSGRAIWQIAAAAMGTVSDSTELYAGAPFGVGYFVGLWLP